MQTTPATFDPMKTNRTKKSKGKDLFAAMMAEEAAMPQAEKHQIEKDTHGGHSAEEKARIYGTSLRSEDLFHSKHGAR